MNELSVSELHERRTAGEDVILIDVREADELATASLLGSVHIPMRQVPVRMAEIPLDRDVVIMCHHGGRSARVTEYLNDNGYSRVMNLSGGIDAWSNEIDPTVPRY